MNKVGEAYTENCVGRREFAAPESWYSFEMQVGVDEGFNAHRSQSYRVLLSLLTYIHVGNTGASGLANGKTGDTSDHKLSQHNFVN